MKLECTVCSSHWLYSNHKVHKSSECFQNMTLLVVHKVIYFYPGWNEFFWTIVDHGLVTFSTCKIQFVSFVHIVLIQLYLAFLRLWTLPDSVTFTKFTVTLFFYFIGWWWRYEEEVSQIASSSNTWNQSRNKWHCGT